MNITILTLFPDMFSGFATNSIMKRAIGKGVATINVVNIRDYTKDKYGRTDTPPIGGGAGLIEKCQPIVDALKANRKEDSHVILMSPRGHTYDQKAAQRFAELNDLIIVCGHYEGIDERVNAYCDELISIGDYVLTGGEIPAMAIADSVIRLLDGAITKDSLTDESFNADLLEYPQYTEPYDSKAKRSPTSFTAATTKPSKNGGGSNRFCLQKSIGPIYSRRFPYRSKTKNSSPNATKREPQIGKNKL